MTRRLTTTPPCLLLLDACVVIEVHQRSCWDGLLAATRTAVPSIVANNEARYFRTASGEQAIDLPALITAGRLQECSATLHQLNAIRGVFDDAFVESVDPGELEAFAVLRALNEEDPMLFCTCDRLAIHALALIGLSHRGISLEEVLRECGLSRPVGREYTEEFFGRQLALGKEKLIRGEGLRR